VAMLGAAGLAAGAALTVSALAGRAR